MPKNSVCILKHITRISRFYLFILLLTLAIKSIENVIISYEGVVGVIIGGIRLTILTFYNCDPNQEHTRIITDFFVLILFTSLKCNPNKHLHLVI